MIEETKVEITQPNPGEETPEEEIPEQPQTEPEETPEETPPEESVPQETDQPKYTDREKQYYARMKKAEDDAKKAKDDAKKAKEELVKAKKSPSPDISNVDEILEVQQATKGLSSEEVIELKARALILDVPLSEARKDVNFTLWQTAWKEKVARNKQALTPTNKQELTEKPKTLAEKLKAAKTLEEKEKLLTESGHYKSPRPRSASPARYEVPV